MAVIRVCSSDEHEATYTSDVLDQMGFQHNDSPLSILTESPLGNAITLLAYTVPTLLSVPDVTDGNRIIVSYIFVENILLRFCKFDPALTRKPLNQFELLEECLNRLLAALIHSGFDFTISRFHLNQLRDDLYLHYSTLVNDGFPADFDIVEEDFALTYQLRDADEWNTLSTGDQNAVLWTEQLYVQGVADAHGRASHLADVLCALGSRFDANVVATRGSSFQRGCAALRSVAIYGNPLYEGDITVDGVGHACVEAILTLFDAGVPPHQLVTFTYHQKTPSLAFFNLLSVYANGDSAKKGALFCASFNRVIEQLLSLKAVVAGVDRRSKFDYAMQLLNALVPGVHNASSVLTFEMLDDALKLRMPVLLAMGGERAGDASSRVKLLLEDAEREKSTRALAPRSGGSHVANDDIDLCLSSAALPALEALLRDARVVSLQSEVAVLAAHGNHLEVALKVLRVGSSTLTAIFLGTAASPTSHPLLRAIVAARSKRRAAIGKILSSGPDAEQEDDAKGFLCSENLVKLLRKGRLCEWHAQSEFTDLFNYTNGDGSVCCSFDKQFTDFSNLDDCASMFERLYAGMGYVVDGDGSIGQLLGIAAATVRKRPRAIAQSQIDHFDKELHGVIVGVLNDAGEKFIADCALVGTFFDKAFDPDALSRFNLLRISLQHVSATLRAFGPGVASASQAVTSQAAAASAKTEPAPSMPKPASASAKRKIDYPVSDLVKKDGDTITITWPTRFSGLGTTSSHSILKTATLEGCGINDRCWPYLLAGSPTVAKQLCSCTNKNDARHKCTAAFKKARSDAFFDKTAHFCQP
jgi:hypothetical protein